MLFQVASSNPKKTCKVLRTVSGKRPLQEATEILNRLPLQPVDEPVAEENDVEAAPEIRLQNQMNIQEPDHGDIYESLPSTSPPQSPSYLSDLFDDFPVDSESLRDKLNRVLDNQKVLFSLISKLMGEVSQLSRSQGVRVQGWEVGNVTTPNSSMDSALSWGLGDRQDTEHDLFGGGAGDNIQAMPQNSDGTGEGEDSFFREVVKIKGESCSMGNFATRLVRTLFSFEELINRNCRGSKGKEALDSSKLTTVKEYCFKMYPTPPGLREQQWGKCIIAIDEYLRRKKKEISNRQD